MDSDTNDAVPHPLVRGEVRRILTQSQAYRRLPEETRRELAHDMVKIANYFTLGETGDNVPAAVVLADDATSGANLPSDRIQRPSNTAGDRLKGTAATQGSEKFTNMVRDVNFPQFVAGLIHGVFDAIVDSSIKQMTAYAELVKNVSKSVDQYMRDNVTTNQARDYLSDRYPDYLEVDISEEQPKLKPKEGHDEDNMPDFFKDLGLSQPVQSLDEDTVEQQLVPAARRRMAMDRQQLLATMVLMGINRLVVTNGSISASVLFKLDTTDTVKDTFKQTATQMGGKSSSTRPGFWSWLSGSDTYSYSYGRFNVETTQSEDSEATIKMHADLTGKVNVNFKSDYFPLERIADVLQVGQIQERAGNKAATGGTPSQSGNQPAPVPSPPPPTTGTR